MSSSRVNIAGLTSLQQQSEMKSILAGTWPPLKPLPVFRYETSEYRAMIDFDGMRGEWVCRKTSLPSNKVQELRGQLREVTLALPHGETEILIEDAEQQEQESERDTNRRLQAIRDWRENYENAARYFELRNYLSENQRSEIDDSLRLSLTARQLQFNSKNIAYIFDALSTAGGRFTTLIEFAKRNKARQDTAPQAQAEEALPEAEHAIDHDKQRPGNRSREFKRALDNNDAFVRDQEAAERCTDAEELPALSIRNVFPERYQAPSTEWITHTAVEPFEIETPEIVDADSPSLVEHPHQEGHRPPAFTGFVAQVQTGQSPADRSMDPPSRFPVLEISAFHLAVFASLFLFVVIAFVVGLTLGRGPLGSRLREVPESMLSFDAKSPILRDQADETTPRNPTPPLASSDKPANTNRLDKPAPSDEKSKENTPGSEYVAGVRSTNSNSTSTTGSKPSAEAAHSPKAIGEVRSAPRIPVSSRLTSAIRATPHLPGPSTILVDVPSPGGQPFRVSFPEKAIAASPSLAMSSQLSVLVSPVPGPVGARKPGRLEAGELVSFVWPRYPRPEDRYAHVLRVRATIGSLGQVRDVKFLSGSTSLLPATMRAIRQWRYKPTLLDKRPVQAQQDLTIEFWRP